MPGRPGSPGLSLLRPCGALALVPTAAAHGNHASIVHLVTLHVFPWISDRPYLVMLLAVGYIALLYIAYQRLLAREGKEEQERPTKAEVSTLLGSELPVVRAVAPAASEHLCSTAVEAIHSCGCGLRLTDWLNPVCRPRWSKTSAQRLVYHYLFMASGLDRMHFRLTLLAPPVPSTKHARSIC
jgi:hypothetical protein